MKTIFATIALCLSLVSFVWANSAEPLHTLLDLQQRWAQVNYLSAEDDKEPAFKDLLALAQAFSQEDPQNDDSLIWLGIVQSSTANAIGGLSALPLVKDAKANFEKVIARNPQALSGRAYTNLAILYHKVPGWPVAFGSDKKAAKLFKQSFELNPTGIDNNYFYAEFLYDEGEYKQAKTHLLTAQQASPRPDLVMADQGRQAEIKALLAKVEKKL